MIRKRLMNSRDQSLTTMVAAKSAEKAGAALLEGWLAASRPGAGCCPGLHGNQGLDDEPGAPAARRKRRRVTRIFGRPSASLLIWDI
jgi:hypothetical protein